MTVTRDRPWLVFGASGYIGTHLVPRLLAEGVPVRAAARRQEVMAARDWHEAERVAADALDPSSLAPALEGVSVAYYLVHSMAAGSGFRDLDRRAAAHFRDAAARAGVQRIVYLGGLIPDDADSEHIVSRRETGEILREGPVPVTEVRAGIVVGPGSAAFEVMRDLVFHLPVMITPRWVRAKSPPVALNDLLTWLIRLPALPQEGHATYDAAGPDLLDYGTMMRILAQEAGRREPVILPVPVLSPRLSSYWLKAVTSVPTPVARALIEGLKHDFHADPEPLLEISPLTRLSFRESVQAAFQAEREHTLQARWTEGAFSIRGERIDHAYYAKRAGASAESTASPASLWRVINRIGGDHRYFAWPALWTIREVLDWLVGGPGLGRGRRHPTELRLGDRVDSWHVIGLVPERSLTLQFGMRAPGSGVLEFVLTPRDDGGTRLDLTAYWHPAGVWGLVYWGLAYPFHDGLFRAMVRSVIHTAESEGAVDKGADA